MNEILIKAGCIPYILSYKDMNENGYIEISINLGCYLIAFLQYFPCGDKRYDYYMIIFYRILLMVCNHDHGHDLYSLI